MKKKGTFLFFGWWIADKNTYYGAVFQGEGVQQNTGGVSIIRDMVALREYPNTVWLQFENALLYESRIFR